MADPLGDRRAGDCGGIFGARRISSVVRAEPHSVSLGLTAGYSGRGNRSGPAVALVPVSFRELCRRSGERCFRNAPLTRVHCTRSDESSVRRTSVARIPGLSKPIQRDTKGPPRKYGTGPLFELIFIELVTRLPSLLFSLPRRLRAARPCLSFPSF